MGPGTVAPESALIWLPARAASAGATALPEKTAASGTPSAGVYLDGAQNLAEAFEAAVYRKQSVQTAASLNYSGASFTLAGDDGSVSAASRQLEFSFFQETRSEELLLFRQRTGAVAEGLATGTRETYVQASQRIAARFEFSLSLSGEALANFAGASEELADKDQLFELLLGYADKLLKQADRLFQDFFASLSGGNALSYEELFHRIQEQFSNGGLLESLGRILGEGTAPAADNLRAGAVQLQFKFAASFEVQAEVTVQQSDPIIFDLNGDGFNLTSYRNGARFDILGNGGVQTTAFVNGGDAFLALDRNGNGVIDSGAELFGDQRGAANGFEELRRLDSNRDGVIDARDPAYASLLLFRDNGNGVTEPGELLSLRDAGIVEISLNYANTREETSGGNLIAQISAFRRADGTTGRVGDAILNYVV